VSDPPDLKDNSRYCEGKPVPAYFRTQERWSFKLWGYTNMHSGGT